MNPIIKQYTKLVEYLGKALGPDYEIVLHDLTEGNYSVVAIANGFNSNRHLGSPITQKALSFIHDGVYLSSDYQIGYPGVTHEQSETISSTMFIKDDSGSLIGMLCINFNTKHNQDILNQISVLLKLSQPAEATPSVSGSPAEPKDNLQTSSPHSSADVPEVFSSSLEELISDVISETISPSTPVERMNQSEKMEIVRKLKENGVFSIKGAVREVAGYLHCSEPSIYRYLKSI